MIRLTPAILGVLLLGAMIYLTAMSVNNRLRAALTLPAPTSAEMVRR